MRDFQEHPEPESDDEMPTNQVFNSQKQNLTSGTYIQQQIDQTTIKFLMDSVISIISQEIQEIFSQLNVAASGSGHSAGLLQAHFKKGLHLSYSM